MKNQTSVSRGDIITDANAGLPMLGNLKCIKYMVCHIMDACMYQQYRVCAFLLNQWYNKEGFQRFPETPFRLEGTKKNQNYCRACSWFLQYFAGCTH